MYLIPDLGVIFVWINKNASTGLRRALRGAYRCEKLTPAEGWQRPEIKIAMLRDPYRRMESAYRMYNPPMKFSPWVLRQMASCGPDADAHLRQQIRFCMNAGRWMIDEVIRWDFVAFAERFGLPPIERDNPSGDRPTPWTEEAKAVFEDCYWADLMIWNSHEASAPAAEVPAGRVRFISSSLA